MNTVESVRIFFSQIASLLKKEFLVIIKDPANRFVLFVPIFIQCLLFGYAATYDLRYAPYVVVDESQSASSREFLAEVDAAGIYGRIATLSSTAEAAPYILNNKAVAAITVPSDFEDKLYAGQSAPIQVIVDGRNSITATLASAYLSQIASQFSLKSGAARPAVSVETRAWYNVNLDSRWNFLTALIAALSLIQTLLTAAFTVSRERENSSFDQLLVTPLVPAQILVGKALPPLAVGIIQSTIILLIIQFWFGVPMQGSPAVLYLGLILFNLAAVGIGLCVSSLTSTMQQSMLYSFLIIVPMVMLSGIVSPVDNMARAVYYLSYVNPLRFAVDIVRRTYVEGVGFMEIWLDFVPLFIIASITMPIAGWLFRHKLS